MSGPEFDCEYSPKIDGVRADDIAKECIAKKSRLTPEEAFTNGVCRIAKICDDGHAIFLGAWFSEVGTLGVVNAKIKMAGNTLRTPGLISSLDEKSSRFFMKSFPIIGCYADEYHHWLIYDLSRTFTQADLQLFKECFPRQ